MRKSILGRKLGMSQVFDTEGAWVPVTLIEAGPCTVLQVKTDENDGYKALQVGFADSKKRARKPQDGLFQKLQTAPKKLVREIPPFADRELNAGDKFDLSVLEGVQRVDVSGDTKGRGFRSTIQRWNHHIGPKSHGSKSKRVVGSIGMHQDPGRVLPGKKMPGHYGDERVKVRNLDVVSIDLEQNLLIVKGAVPGAQGGFLYIEESLQ
ncbi:MAG: 50S ribosomal protein L3 [Planctomycetota bacterium]